MKLVFGIFLLGALVPTFVAGVGAGQSIVQTYFVPLPEDDLLNSFLLINQTPDFGARSPVTTIISIAVAADKTIVVYDHWEDGYELDPSNPTQSSTAIWGDGNLANGAAPGVTTNAGDILQGGQSIVIQNDVPVPRNGDNAKYFDGKDKISATFPIAITRSGYPGNAGSLMAGAVEVFNTESWGVNYIAPVGMNSPSVTSAFETCSLHVMGGKDGTTVTYPYSPGNITSKTAVIDAGQNLIFTVNSGDKVTANFPVQVSLIAGDVNSNYEMRWYALIPVEDWTNEYYSPVAETFGNTGFWFYNAQKTDITIKFEGGNVKGGSGTFVLPPNTSIIKNSDTNGDIPINGVGNNVNALDFSTDYTGLRFSSVDGRSFYALVQIDADLKNVVYAQDSNGVSTSAINGQGWDWGFPLIPSNQLTPQALVGLGYSCTNPKDCDRQRSVVWVTPVSNAYVFVDFNGDKVFDKSFYVGKLQALLVGDDDFDMSGAVLAAYSGRVGGANDSKGNAGQFSGLPVNIALAWGQNPSYSRLTSDSQRRELDLGTVVVPLPNPWVNKRVVKVVNPNGSVDPAGIIDQVGDVLYYEITASNVGFGNVYGLQIKDSLITDAGGVISGPVETLTTDGYLSPDEKFIWSGSYTVTALDIATKADTVKGIKNDATVTPIGFPPVSVSVFTDIKLAVISGTVTEDVNNNLLASDDKPLAGILITLLDATLNPIATTLTNATGFYQFDHLQAGSYHVKQQNKPSYSDVRDADGGSDLSSILVSDVVGGMEYRLKDFVDELLLSISGKVLEDTNNDDSGDVILANVLIALLDKNNAVLKTTVTDASGNYLFPKLPPGKYSVKETNLAGYGDVWDADQGSDLNLIAVNLSVSDSVNNNFIDEKLGTITGLVTNNAIVKAPLGQVTITLKNANGVVLATTLTNSQGQYTFANLPIGDYTVEETNRSDYPVDVSGFDVTDDKDPFDGSTSGNKNVIKVTLALGELDDGNNFVDTRVFAISGNVKEDSNHDLIGDINLGNVLITLLDKDKVPIKTTVTDASGNYQFAGMEEGTYFVVETNLKGYTDVWDADQGSDLSLISVNLQGANSINNNFVDEVPSQSPSSLPSSSPSRSPSSSPSKAPSRVPSVSPSRSPTVVRSEVPSPSPSENPSKVASSAPSSSPSASPSAVPSSSPSSVPSSRPSSAPSKEASAAPSLSPSTSPSIADSQEPSASPSAAPSSVPSGAPSAAPLFTISGNVKEDINDDNKGDENLTGVIIALADSAGKIIATSVTDVDGNYQFVGQREGLYSVMQTNLNGTYTDVSDKDLGSDLNKITVKLAGADSTENDFVDERIGTISGSVRDDSGNPIVNVLIELHYANGASVIASTTTDSKGEYIFTALPPNEYAVVETNSPAFPIDVSDYDTKSDGDIPDKDTSVDNYIKVTLKPGEDDVGNDFVDSAKGSIAGNVTNEAGGQLAGVIITLLFPNGTTITSVTAADGSYVFTGLQPGNYTLKETNPPEYPDDVSDYDTLPEASDPFDKADAGADNVIRVNLTPGEADIGNNFVDTALGNISGTVTEDINNDDSGDVPLVGVLITLLDSNGVTLRTTVTDSTGFYVFVDVNDGSYFVVEKNLDDTFTDVSDRDGGADLNKIAVTLVNGAGSTGNDFVDERPGAISGSVTDDSGKPIVNVLLELKNVNSTTVVASTTTDSNGAYLFAVVPPGEYVVVETNSPAFPIDVSDYDTKGDNDVYDTDTTVDNTVKVTVTPAEVDAGNNFVDSEALSGTPSLSPSDAPILKAPPVAAPTLPPAEYCEAVAFPGCSLCAPFRSTDYCDPRISFSTLIQQRTAEFRTNSSGLVQDGYWFHYLEDKIAAYLLSVDQNAPAPEIFCCETDVLKLYDCLVEKVFTKDLDGIVIKATNFHSNQGVFVLVNETRTGTRSDPLFDLIQKVPTTYNDTMAALSQMQATKIIVEEFVGKSLPTEFKFHVVNGEVAAIDIIDGRDGDCPCYAVVDTDLNRLDKFGCFEPAVIGHIDAKTGCTAIDFETGKRKAGSIKKDLYTCDTIPNVDTCLLKEMTEIAISLGKRIGVYMRVDMFVVDNSIFVQEYSANHMNGLRHCAAKEDKNGCTDSCFLGRMWSEAGGPYGGNTTAVPAKLGGFTALSPAEQCALLTNVQAPKYESKCTSSPGSTPGFLTGP